MKTVLIALAFCFTLFTSSVEATNFESLNSIVENQEKFEGTIVSCGPSYAILRKGPRGGCYYINKNGNKTYVSRICCD